MKVALVTGFDGPVIFSGTKAAHDGTDWWYLPSHQELLRASEGFSTCLRQKGRLCGAGREAAAQDWLGRGVGCQKDKLLFTQAFNLQSSLTLSWVPLFESSEIESVLENSHPTPLQIHNMWIFLLKKQC